MTPIGEQLRSAREQKGLTLERVSDETNIARRYLTALESDDFAVFPGDTYIVGFIRNYADYLSLPSDELVASYRNMRIQEQPVPIEELISRRGPSKLLLAGVAGSAILVVIVLSFLLFRRNSPQPGVETTAIKPSAPMEYRVEGSPLEKRLYEGDTILVTAGKDRYKLRLSKIDDAVTIETPSGSVRLMLGEEGTIDLDRNNQPEIKVLVGDFAKKDPSRGAMLHIEYTSAEAALRASAEVPIPAQVTGDQSIGTVKDQQPPTPPASQAAAQSGAKTVLFEAGKSPYPFVISVTFRGACMFRYEVDRRDRDERYYRKGETITVSANNSVRLWASNAQSAKLTVQASGGKSADLELGGGGEVAVKRIAWSQTDSGSWNLSAVDVD